jgi:hypothetical protein
MSRPHRLRTPSSAHRGSSVHSRKYQGRGPHHTFCAVYHPVRKDRVNELHAGVKKLSRHPKSVNIARLLLCRARLRGRDWNGDVMSVVVYIVLTLAIFALLGLVQKLVEGL